jgi:hypothetical protein
MRHAQPITNANDDTAHASAAPNTYPYTYQSSSPHILNLTPRPTQPPTPNPQPPTPDPRPPTPNPQAQSPSLNSVLLIVQARPLGTTMQRMTDEIPSADDEVRDN